MFDRVGGGGTTEDINDDIEGAARGTLRARASKIPCVWSTNMLVRVRQLRITEYGSFAIALGFAFASAVYCSRISISAHFQVGGDMPRFAAAILGESGQAGGSVVKSLLAEPRCSSIVVVSRRQLDGYDSMPRIKQHIVDSNELASEAISVLKDNNVKVCFICVGKPSKITRGELENLEVHTPTAFAKASKEAGCVRHISLLSTAAANLKQQVEKNFKEIGFESVAFFSDKPFSLVTPRDKMKTAGCASIVCRTMSSWILPRREERERESRVDTLGQAMVMVAVSSLKEAGPPTARYEGESLNALFAAS